MTKFIQVTCKAFKFLTCSVLMCGALSVTAADRPLAKLSNGETLSDQDFGAYLNRRVDLKPLARNFWGAESALREMLMTRVLVLEGLRLKEPFRGGEPPERFDDAYAHVVYQKLVQTCSKPADEAASRKFYDQHPEVFTAPATARLARVMLPITEKIDGVPAMAWLMSQAEAMAKGTTTFDQVAGKVQAIYKMEPQGDLGWVNLTGNVTVMRALISAKPGEMVGPVRDGDFAYLFLLGEKRESRVMKWDEVKNSAANTQVVSCRERANKDLSEKLYKQYGVVIDENAIKAIFKMPVRPSGAASAAPETSTK